MYVIRRNDGAFVAVPGSEHSHTRDITLAATWAMRSEAVKHVCPENEAVWAVYDLLQYPLDGGALSGRRPALPII